MLEALSIDSQGLDSWRCEHGVIVDFMHTGTAPTEIWPCRPCRDILTRRKALHEAEDVLDELVEDALEQASGQDIANVQAVDFMHGYVASLKRTIRTLRKLAAE